MPTQDDRLRLLEADVRDFARQMKERLASMDEEMGNLTTIVSLLTHEDGDVPDMAPARVLIDQFWTCKRCNAKLGVFDHESDEMRIRYRDLFLYVIPGEGGRLKYTCRGCGYVNVLDGTKRKDT